MKSALKERLLIITAALERDGSEQALAFCKMAPFVFKAVSQVAQVTKTSEEDVLGEVLCVFSAVRDLYRAPVYRYQDSHYVCRGEEGGLLLLETPKMNKHRRSLKVPRVEVSEVRRAKFFSFLYRKIQHQCAEILRAAHASKRGLSVEIIPLDLFDGDTPSAQADFSSDPESLVSAAQMYHEIVPQISEPAHLVLDFFLEGGSAEDTYLALSLRMTVNSVRAAKLEILRAYHRMERSFVQDEALQPIYMKASEL